MVRSLRILSIKDLLVKISAQDFLDYQNEHLATTRAIWQAQSDEKVARAISKWAPRHSESDLIGPKWREGCASDPKISTAPQQERSDTHKVPRRLRQHMSEFNKTSRASRKWTWKIEKKTKTMFYLGLSHFFVEVYKVLRLPQEMNPRHPKFCTCHTESSSCPKSKFVSFTKQDFWPFQNVDQVHQINIAPAKQHDLQNHLSFWPTPGNVLATCNKCHPCHADEKVYDVLHLSRQRRFRPQNVPKVPRPSHRMDI